jgi:hypothetical protein
VLLSQQRGRHSRRCEPGFGTKEILASLDYILRLRSSWIYAPRAATRPCWLYRRLRQVLEGTAAPRAPAHRGAVLTVIEPPPKWIVDCLRAWNAGDTAEADVLAELTPTDP